VKPIAYRLDDHCRLLDPNVGDAELREIVFRNPDVILRLALVPPRGDVACEITLTSVKFFAMESNHVQNVIEGAFVYDNLDASTLSIDARLRNHMPPYVWGRPRKLLHVVPTAGPDLICLCDEIAICSE
jgi:hypothetical protein